MATEDPTPGTEPTSATAGAPCWIELLTPDVDGAASFYEALFGWTAADTTLGERPYRTMSTAAGPIAGITSTAAPGGVGVWNSYVATGDVEAAVGRSVAAGGQLVVPVHPVGDLGIIAEILDPGGAALGLWQAGTDSGSQGVGGPGAPVWYELHTRSYLAAIDFYAAALGWTATPVADGATLRYSTVSFDGQEMIGIFDAADEIPAGLSSFWMLYLGVEDLDAAAATAVEAGGRVLDGPVDTPSGRIATVADPTGAIFKIRAT